MLIHYYRIHKAAFNIIAAVNDFIHKTETRAEAQDTLESIRKEMGCQAHNCSGSSCHTRQAAGKVFLQGRQVFKNKMREEKRKQRDKPRAATINGYENEDS